MESLRATVEKIDFSTQLEQVERLLEGVSTKITFWGSRVITLADKSGSVSLNTIARLVEKAAKDRSDQDNLTWKEMKTGSRIVTRVQELYKESDAQRKQANFFTRICNAIREFSLTPYTDRFYIEKGLGGSYADQLFRGISKDKYEREVGPYYVDSGGRFPPRANGTIGPPLRIMMEESYIAQKVFDQSR